MFPEERYSFASFTWARSALASRCFAETHLEKFLGGGEVVPEDRVIVGSKEGFVMFCHVWSIFSSHHKTIGVPNFDAYPYVSFLYNRFDIL